MLASTKKMTATSIEEIKKASQKTVEEGIKSSDEEEDAALAAELQEDPEVDERVTVEKAARDEERERLIAQSEADLNQKVMSFEKGDEHLFPDGKEREQLEHNYGFSKETIEQYSAVLEGRLETLG